MIGYMEGEVLAQLKEDQVLLRTQTGIGYNINTFEDCFPGEAKVFFITSVIKEDAFDLYGFGQVSAKIFFEQLLQHAKGVGPKTAFAILKHLGVEGLFDAIFFEDEGVIKKVPGVGGKTASQIILDLKSKAEFLKKVLQDNQHATFSVRTSEKSESKKEKDKEKARAKGQDKEKEKEKDLIQTTILACKELGYDEKRIYPLAKKLFNQEQIDTPQQFIKLILKEMVIE